MPDDLLSSFPSEEFDFSPLLRLRQLAREIKSAIARNDMELVFQAASLLPSSLARWNAIYPMMPVGAGDAAQIALDTRTMLDECEAALTEAMLRVKEEIRHLQKGKKMLSHYRSRRTTLAVGRRLDTAR